LEKTMLMSSNDRSGGGVGRFPMDLPVDQKSGQAGHQSITTKASFDC